MAAFKARLSVVEARAATGRLKVRSIPTACNGIRAGRLQPGARDFCSASPSSRTGTGTRMLTEWTRIDPCDSACVHVQSLLQCLAVEQEQTGTWMHKERWHGGGCLYDALPLPVPLLSGLPARPPNAARGARNQEPACQAALELFVALGLPLLMPCRARFRQFAVPQGPFVNSIPMRIP
jgi:hypothetical protein